MATVSPDDVQEPEDKLKPTREWLLRFAREAESDPCDMPSDLAEQHDFYTHGKPKQERDRLQTND
jgi:hypothetical protein